nr:MAG TPA: hypothetical protein [Caudoviricetes sp.]
MDIIKSDYWIRHIALLITEKMQKFIIKMTNHY